MRTTAIERLRRSVYGPPQEPGDAGPASRFTAEALERHKREGMDLAVRARLAALAVIAVMLPLINFDLEVLYYEAILAGFAAIGWLQRRAARVGRSRAEMFLISLDLLLMTLAIVVPNPLGEEARPLAMQYRSETFIYFFLLLAAGTLAYSARTVWGMGLVTAGLWGAALVALRLIDPGDAALGEAAAAAFGGDTEMARLLDPTAFLYGLRVQEVVVLLIAAGILALAVGRYGRLLLDNAALERERTNLARYFSPNVVEELSRNDEPLKQIRSQDIAVLFVDIFGFTSFAARRPAGEVIETLRDFHRLMEAEVFRHGGTLDKYLGDGLMATFGTPVAGPADAANALACARAMRAAMADWNVGRRARGEAPLRAGIGLHFGPAVLGNIGANRLEFAVIGNTVNVASRVEALTRALDVDIAATDALIEAARASANGGAGRPEGADVSGPAHAADPCEGFTRHEAMAIRGVDGELTIWALG